MIFTRPNLREAIIKERNSAIKPLVNLIEVDRIEPTSHLPSKDDLILTTYTANL